MKAIQIPAYGAPDVIQLRDVAAPTPKANEVLVKVVATSVNFSTGLLVTGQPFLGRLMVGGPTTPKIKTPGNDLAGRVIAVGSAVTRFRLGDAVFGDLAGHGYGTYAELVAVPESALTLKPAKLSFEEAAAAPEAGLVALQALRDLGGLQAGEHVLIVGASGGIGTFAVQLAKYFGAEVTAVVSPRNIDLVRTLGADHVIDYTREDFARNGQQYDLILSTAGYRSLADYKRALKPGGRYVTTGGSLKQVFAALLFGALVGGGHKMAALNVKPNKDLDYLGSLMESGAVRVVIDRCYPLSQSAEAIRYYLTGKTRGKIIIQVAPEGA
ncbi:MAG: NAD(P)-dependent alcohol dehydrogenase [Chloroflexi bacterium]|uniref:NAD(P)-dependent alcohol dehydrogenase n=1 Tax=Candidatus Flexifilum breve TaxID=3140694 RepID=UPI003134F324|nr:NAD(P)-dependent alcohol dehydrogenase [Chloroflexota bacterium]